jgi:hypothetical protein
MNGVCVRTLLRLLRRQGRSLRHRSDHDSYLEVQRTNDCTALIFRA